MNFLTTFKDYGWAAIGSVGGLLIGAAANLLKNRSWFVRDPGTCIKPFNNSEIFRAINQFRENEHVIVRNSRLTPVLFSWVYPIVHIGPMLGYVLCDTLKRKNLDEQNTGSGKKRTWSYILSVVYSGLKTTTVTMCAIGVRDLFCKRHFPEWLDISGHVITQYALTNHAVTALRAVSKTGSPTQKKFHSVICAVVALTDCIWMYNTAANCHSVVDVVGAVALTGFMHFAMVSSVRNV